MQNKKKPVLAILIACPLTENIYDRIGVEVFSGDFDVVVIDCLSWFSRGHAPLIYTEVNRIVICRVDSKSALKKTFKVLSPRFILDAIGKGKLTRQIQGVCKWYQALYITYYLIPLPSPQVRKSLWKIFCFSPVTTSYKIIRFILQQMLQHKPLPPDIALLVGSGASSPWVLSAKKLVFTGSPDYFTMQKTKKDALLTKQSKVSLLSGSYILFIDDCLSTSFDYAIAKQKPIIDQKLYFHILDEYFSTVETYFGIPVVIAAHPNGKQYPNYKESFSGRMVLFDATAELSLNCRFVMTHFSSAIAYPVMLRKQILLLNLKVIKKQIQGLLIANIAALLKCRVVDIDDFCDVNQLAYLDKQNVAESNYKDYESRFIVSANFNGSNSFEPLSTYLKSLN